MTGAFSGSHVHCGDVVRERDGAHLGEVVAVFDGMVRVRWEGSRWLSDLPAEDVVLVERVKHAAVPLHNPYRPRTVVESPRRRLERELAERAS